MPLGLVQPAGSKFPPSDPAVPPLRLSVTASALPSVKNDASATEAARANTRPTLVADLVVNMETLPTAFSARRGSFLRLLYFLSKSYFRYHKTTNTQLLGAVSQP